MNKKAKTKASAPAAQGNALNKIGGIAILLMLALIPLQVYLYMKYPPPAAAVDYFNLFAKNKLLALVSLDLLFAVSNILIIFVYLPVYFMVRDANRELGLLSMALAFTGITALLTTNPAFGMMNLYAAYAKTDMYVLQSLYMSAGESLLASMTGTAYIAYYLMNAIAILILSFLMVKSGKFGRIAPIAGIIAGLLMTVPASAGQVGLVMSFMSMVPYVIWLVMVAVVLLKSQK